MNNLVCGTLRLEPVMDRATPYHVPHSTQVAGYAVIYGGDDRYVGNVFLGGDAAQAYGAGARRASAPPATARPVTTATRPRSRSTSRASTSSPPGDHQRFLGVKQPVYIRENVYAAGARPFEGEQDALVLDGAASVASSTRATRSTSRPSCPTTSTAPAWASSPGWTSSASASPTPTSRSATALPAVMDVDLLGERKEHGQSYPAGPIAALAAGTSRVRVW